MFRSTNLYGLYMNQIFLSVRSAIRAKIAINLLVSKIRVFHLKLVKRLSASFWIEIVKLRFYNGSRVRHIGAIVFCVVNWGVPV